MWIGGAGGAKFVLRSSRHVLKARISIGRAIKPCVGEMRRIAAVLAARCGGMPQEPYENENERERLGLPAHRATLLCLAGVYIEPFKPSIAARYLFQRPILRRYDAFSAGPEGQPV